MRMNIMWGRRRKRHTKNLVIVYADLDNDNYDCMNEIAIIFIYVIFYYYVNKYVLVYVIC